MRKIISILILIWLTLAASACMSEVKPLLKPADVDVQTRIVNQQKRLKLDITAHLFTREEAKPLQESLNRIQERYDRLKAQGEISQKETESLKHMLDENSDLIFGKEQSTKGKGKSRKN